MIILLGLVVLGLFGFAVVIAGLSTRSMLVVATGVVLVLMAVGAGVAIKASCDPGCEVGSGQDANIPGLGSPGPAVR